MQNRTFTRIALTLVVAAALPAGALGAGRVRGLRFTRSQVR